MKASVISNLESFSDIVNESEVESSLDVGLAVVLTLLKTCKETGEKKRTVVVSAANGKGVLVQKVTP